MLITSSETFMMYPDRFDYIRDYCTNEGNFSTEQSIHFISAQNQIRTRIPFYKYLKSKSDVESLNIQQYRKDSLLRRLDRYKDASTITSTIHDMKHYESIDDIPTEEKYLAKTIRMIIKHYDTYGSEAVHSYIVSYFQLVKDKESPSYETDAFSAMSGLVMVWDIKCNR